MKATGNIETMTNIENIVRKQKTFFSREAEPALSDGELFVWKCVKRIVSIALQEYPC